MILLFRHGWGFDAGFWGPLAALLPGWPRVIDDRGYFGAPSDPRPDGPCVVIAHSFGAMRTLAAPPAQCRGLIAINGFDRFTGGGEMPGLPPRIVERMVARFASEPMTVLGDFRRRCGAEAPSGPANLARLREDLLMLRHGDRGGDSAHWPTPILSLQAVGDPLLPAPMRDHAFAAAPMVERRTHAEGGHLLPATDPRYCAEAVRAFLRQVK